MMDDAVEVRGAGPKGRGVFARRAFRRGEVVLAFGRGRIVRADEAYGLDPWEREHLGELSAEACQVLPEPRCYINHACAPNAISDAETVRAWRDIAAGEEITIDYRLNALDTWELDCRCTADREPHPVRGSFLSLPTDLRASYLPYAPPFVQAACPEAGGTPPAAAAWPVIW